MAAVTTQSESLIQLPMADFIFGTTPGMQEARASLEAALRCDLPVLIEGESGTGKEIVARYLHLRSDRSMGPFVRVNCGATPGRMLDSEVFGRRRHTQGVRDGKTDLGSVGLASRGTVFLDEFAEMDLTLQARVLDALRTHGRPGQGEEENARVLCATSVDLEGAVSGRKVLRELATEFVHRIKLLPLRERKKDLPQLCEYLVEKFAFNFGRPKPRLDGHVLEVFERWNWPGNIRELENWIARIVIFGTDEAIGGEFNQRTGQLTVGRRRHGVRSNLTRFRRARGRG